MEQPLQNWPPAYNLRLSTKARHAHLKVIPNKGLEVVIPKRMQKYFCVEELLSQKRDWIVKHLSKLIIKPLQHIFTLDLRALGEIWTVEYKQSDNSKIQIIVLPGNKMVLYGNVQDIALTHRSLKLWLKEYARKHLAPWLKTLSLMHDLPFQKTTIRAQKTLWGSCNVDKNISLNYKLLFIPMLCAQHVLLHELCHTKYLNHSKRFWNLLLKLDPQTEIHNRMVRESDGLVPHGL